MIGRSETLIVEQESAAPPWHETEKFGISATHSGMVEFKGPSDSGFVVVLGAIVRYCRKTPQVIQSRRSDEQKILQEERRLQAEGLLKIKPLLRTDSELKDINELYLVPHEPCTYFTGRSKYSETLREAFGFQDLGRKRTRRKVFVIYGLGGSGKTQFCLKFARDSRSSYVEL